MKSFLNADFIKFLVSPIQTTSGTFRLKAVQTDLLEYSTRYFVIFLFDVTNIFKKKKECTKEEFLL
jgi:hypothetical protein